MDFGVFDSLIDAVAVINEEKKIVYCNEGFAAVAGASVRRLTKGAVFAEVIELSDRELFPMGGGEKGKDSPEPLNEMNYSAPGSGKSGKLQVAVQPFLENGGSQRWVIVMHDVTLEETLHTKYQGELEQKEGYIRELQEAKAKLEQYSRNLEQMVEERTAEVRVANRMLNAIMNSLGQGFVVFNKQGLCSNIYTKACEQILEGIPEGRQIGELLRLPAAEFAQFQKWIMASFSEALPFESMVELAPARYNHSQGRYVTLNFYPIRDEESAITNLVLVANDRTREFEAEQALAKEQQFIKMVMRVVKNRDQFSQFLNSVRQMIQHLRQLSLNGSQAFDFGEAFRVLHTIEGESGLFSAQVIRDASRACQEVMEPARFGEEVPRDEIFAALMREIGNLEGALNSFIADNREVLDALRVGGSRNVEVSAQKLAEFAEVLEAQRCPPGVRRWYDEELLKQPLTLSLRHFNEVAQHVAQVQGKLLRNLEFDCDQVKIRPGAFEGVISAMVHAFRNAVDHGIESPDIRISRGKPDAGTIKVSAVSFAKGSQKWIRVQVEDDGGGIHPDVIRQKLIAKDPAGPYQSLSDEQIIQYVFEPGFSSRDSVGAFSGRGVGMDAIKTEVERIGGTVRIESAVGKGTRLQLEFPDVVVDESIALSA